jgi:formylglycine-generating enzyme required for sulfatase activity
LVTQELYELVWGNYSNSAQTDPRGAVSIYLFRVIRGGSWRSNDENELRSATRGGGWQFARMDNIGFRLVRHP